MILRRLTKHVNDQNWFAVALDFVIVVVGVFIGVQVGNWNSGRLDKRVYDEAYARVIVEMKQNLSSYRWILNGVG